MADERGWISAVENSQQIEANVTSIDYDWMTATLAGSELGA